MLPSPTDPLAPHAVVRDLVDLRTSEDDVIAVLEEQGTPLVSPAGEGRVDVTFVYVADGSEKSVIVHDLVTHHDGQVALSAVAGSRIWAATVRWPADLRDVLVRRGPRGGAGPGDGLRSI